MKTARKMAVMLMSALAALPCISIMSANAESLNDQVEKEPTRGTVSPNVWYTGNPSSGNSSNGLFRYRRYSDWTGETEIRHYLSGNRLIEVKNTGYDSSWHSQTPHTYSEVQPYGADISSSYGSTYYLRHEAKIYSGTTSDSYVVNYYYVHTNL